MKCLEIKFENSWILAHKDDDVLPVDSAEEFILKKIPVLKVLDKSLNFIDILVDDDVESLKDIVVLFCFENFCDDRGSAG